MNNFKNVSEDKLLHKCEFYNSLKDQWISKKDYLHAIGVWNIFKINAICDYNDLYLETDDVLLLVSVFEKFINTCLDYYQLDPCHYFTNPGLSWDAIGGISYIAKRFSKANNKYMQ